MQALPMILAGGGALMQSMAARDAADERRSILNRQMERDDAATRKSADQVLQEGQRYGMQARQDALQQAEDQTFKQTQADVDGAGGAAIATAADAGNESADFLKTKAARAIEEGTRLTSIAREAAKARAPGQMRLDDSLSMARMSGDLNNLWGTTKNLARANSLDAEGVQEPGYGSLGKVASALGQGMAAGGYGMPRTPPINPARSGVNFGAR